MTGGRVGRWIWGHSHGEYLYVSRPNLGDARTCFGEEVAGDEGRDCHEDDEERLGENPRESDGQQPLDEHLGE